jgi:hypothetical protein
LADLAEIPEIIRTYWYDLDWDVGALWALDLPVEMIALGELVWHLEVPLWSRDGADYVLTPGAVLADPETHRERHQRIMDVDLGFPLHVARIKDRWLILDGIHRLAKAHAYCLEQIGVRKVPEAMLQRWDS